MLPASPTSEAVAPPEEVIDLPEITTVIEVVEDAPVEETPVVETLIVETLVVDEEVVTVDATVPATETLEVEATVSPASSPSPDPDDFIPDPRKLSPSDTEDADEKKEPEEPPIQYLKHTKATQKEQLTRYQSLYENKTNCDVIFQVGQEEDEQGIVEFRANRTILSMMIPAMQPLLYDDDDEKESFTQDNPKTIRIEDIPPRQFECLIRFAYQLDPKIDKRDAEPMSSVFGRFQLEALSDQCAQSIDTSMEIAQFFPDLRKSIDEDDEKLKSRCMTWFSKRPDAHKAILDGDDFKKAPLGIVSAIASSKYLACEEGDLWTALIAWSEAQEESQAALESVLEFVRFPLMDAEFFVKNVVSKKVLPERDSYLLLRRLYDPTIECRFNSDRRTPIGPFYIQRFQSLGGGWGFGGSKDVLDFKVDDGVIVLGFGVNPPNAGAQSHATIELFRVDNNEVVGRAEADVGGWLSTATEPKDVPVLKLEDSVKLEKDVWYQVQLTQTGGEARQCTNCNRVVNFDQFGIRVTFTFRDFQNIINGGSSNGTSSTGGQIPTVEILMDS